MQSGWAVSNNLFGNYDPVIPDPTSMAAHTPAAFCLAGRATRPSGGTIGNLSTIQNGDYKEFAPRIGVAWSPRDKWVVRGSFGIFDAPRDAENYTDGALGLGFNPHNQGGGGYANGSSRIATGDWDRRRALSSFRRCKLFRRPSRTLAARNTTRGACRLSTLSSSSWGFSANSGAASCWTQAMFTPAAGT